MLSKFISIKYLLKYNNYNFPLHLSLHKDRFSSFNKEKAKKQKIVQTLYHIRIWRVQIKFQLDRL